ncbi:MAG: histidine kinase [Actinomycetota bacterium]
MAPIGRFATALAVCTASLVAATVGAFTLGSDEALQLDELLLVEQPPDGPAGSPEDHLAWTFELFGGEVRWTEADLAERFTPGFNESFDATGLNAGLDLLLEDLGPIRFHRLVELEADQIRALAVADRGMPVTVWLSVADGGLVESLTLDAVPASPRLPPWQAALVLLAAWSFVAASIAAARFRDGVPAWGLLATGPVVASAILLLSDARVAYAIGRVLPVAALPLAVWLLVRPLRSTSTSVLPVAATVAASFAVVAPFTRDPALIAHPSLGGSWVDSEAVYRSLLCVSSTAAGVVLVALAVIAVRGARGAVRADRTHRWGVAGVAAVWAVAAVGSSVDHAIGDGAWAHGPLAAVSSTAVLLVPAVAVIGILAARWERHGIERLVIDLEADGAQLGDAVAVALEDPTATILVSPDAVHLATPGGEVVDVEELGPDRAITEIRTGDRLVGAVVHDARLRHETERLRAVVAAAGLALEVERLNARVVAQLEEVNASRIRIVQASDAARRQVERDLHDGAQQRLVALGIELQRARRLAGAGTTDELPELLDGAVSEVRDTIADIRAVARGCQPSILAERGLAAAVDALAERTPLPVDIDIPSDPLPEGVRSTAYFVIAEGLTNVAKHAGARSASVEVTRADGTASIRIRDDGHGGATATAGSGLEGLGDRVSAAGGSLAIDTTPTGTTLEVTLPCG